MATQNKKTISVETLWGLIIGFGLFLGTIYLSTDNYLMFINIPSILLVFGCTIAATFISFKGLYVVRALKDLGRILIPVNIGPDTLYKEVERVIEWGRKVRKDGLFSLEKDIDTNKIKDSMLKFGMELLITGYRGEELREMLINKTETTFERNMVHTHILRTMAQLAPAFGMLGTLIGLIIMLDNLAGDSSKLGQGLAIALLTTLYGIVLAQLLFKPAAEKIQQREEIIRFRNLLLTEGFILLSEGQDSITIQDRMNSYLAPEIHFQVVRRDEKPK